MNRAALLWAGIASLPLLALAFGCSSTSTNAAPDGGTLTPTDGAIPPGLDGGTTTTDGAIATTASGGLTCGQVFDCAFACPENDSACEDACLPKGTPEAQTLATDVVDYITTNSCQDEACVKDKCTGAINACVGQKPATTPTGTVPPGAAPATLVGTWHRFSGSTANVEDWTFDANGSAKHYVTTSYGIGGCTNTAIGDTTGTVVFADTKMTYYQTAGFDTRQPCGAAAGTTEPAPQAKYEFTWSLDGAGKLVLLDTQTQACIERPTDSYCTTTFDKE